jgi:hypothetical protein
VDKQDLQRISAEVEKENLLFADKTFLDNLTLPSQIIGISEGQFGGKDIAFYDLFVVETGKLVEHRMECNKRFLQGRIGRIRAVNSDLLSFDRQLDP